jgi:hypothetical protein
MPLVAYCGHALIAAIHDRRVIRGVCDESSGRPVVHAPPRRSRVEGGEDAGAHPDDRSYGTPGRLLRLIGPPDQACTPRRGGRSPDGGRATENRGDPCAAGAYGLRVTGYRMPPRYGRQFRRLFDN